MNLGEAILNYRKEHSLSMEKFSALSGLSKAYISILERNKTPHGNAPAPSIDTYCRVARAMGMDVNDLMAVVDDRISLANRTDPAFLASEPSPTEVISFPVIGSICAGYGGLAQEEYTGDSEELPRSMFRGYPQEELRVFRVSGDSMYPRFLDGDRVLVHAQPSVDNGDVAVVCYNGDEATLKRVYTFRDHIDLVPYNPEYKTKRIDGPDMFQVHVFGKVLKLIRDV